MPVIYKKEVQTVEVVEDITCDLCKKSCKHLIFKDKIKEEWNLNYAQVVVTQNFGYGSKLDFVCSDLINNSETYYLCEDCFESLFLLEKSKNSVL